MKKLEMYHVNFGTSAGVLGAFAFSVDGFDYHFGDLVSFNIGTNSRVGIVAIASDGRVGVCGAFNYDPSEIEIQKVAPHTVVTEELINTIHSHYEVRELTKKMTLKEIEEALGHKVQLVDEITVGGM